MTETPLEIVDVTYTPEFFNNFWGTLTKFRNDNIRVLRYRYKQLPWTSISIIAPIGHCLAGVDPNHYGLYCQADWYRREDSEETYKAILREFKNLGLRKADIPNQWVGIYANWDRFIRPCKDSFIYKSSAVFPTSIEERVLSLIRESNADLAERALCPVPDGFDEFSILRPMQEGYVDFATQNPWILVLSGTAFHVTSQGAQVSSGETLLELTLQKLMIAVDALENGHQVPFPLDPWSANKMFPFFGRFRPGPSVVSGRPFFLDQAKEDLCDSYRARLVRLLRRPEMWRNMQVTIDRCKSSLEKCPISSSVPYDIVAELEAYQNEVVTTFPWVMENPFASVDVTCERPSQRRAQ
jgi:hypothetical protein